MVIKSSQDSKTPNETEYPHEKEFLVIGIGASAGGLEALQQFLRGVPPDIGMAFVVVTHQHPEHTSLLAELLSRETTLRVVQAVDGVLLEPDHVYVSLPGNELNVFNGRLYCRKDLRQDMPPLPIDSFFRSLAEDLKESAVGIVLSGTGSDGTLGLRAIKAESGMTMAQQPQSAKYAGMPSSAIATGLIDYTLAPEQMAEQLIAYAQSAYIGTGLRNDELSAFPADSLQKIFMLLRSRSGHDFSAYKDNTIRRRIQRRMNIHQLSAPKDYIDFLQNNAHEVDKLFKELLITVTSFFRDAEAWQALGEPLKAVIGRLPEHQSLRAWIPGCATGEEVFSLAMLLLECFDDVNRDADVQIFGTDLDADAIELARAGVYPEGIAADVSEQRLERFFVREQDNYKVSKEVRESTIFATQNLIKDPPFTKVDVLCCRNLLIYLDTTLQRRIIPLFHYALNPGGILFLGSSESIGPYTDLFEPVDKRWKIYRRKESATAILQLDHFPIPAAGDRIEKKSTPLLEPLKREAHLATLIEHLLLERFAPVSVVINERGEIYYIHGRTGLYLEPTPGRPRHNILDMAREGLRIELAAAIRECSKMEHDVQRDDIFVNSNGEKTHVELMVSMILKPESLSHLLLVTFRPVPKVVRKPFKRGRLQSKKNDSEAIVQLEQELRHIKESHQMALEELETSNEELKSTNEELQSTNEELQSTNEELETSKEEMQSLNEELSTVNTELQSKVEELSKSNDDMQNLLNSTDIATIFLDNQLNIKRFTEQARELVAMRPSDIGRPLFELTSSISYPHLKRDCQAVLKTLVFREAEVVTDDDKVFVMRILPYRTEENVIEGVVLTFVDISQRKHAEQLGRARQFFEAIFNTLAEPLVVLDSELKVIMANRWFYSQFNLATDKVEGLFLKDIGDGEWDNPQLRKKLQQVLSENIEIEQYSFKVTGSSPNAGAYNVNARRLMQDDSKSDLILLSMKLNKAARRSR